MTPAVKIFFLFAILAVILGAARFLAPKSASPQIVINGQTILVEIADTPEKIVQGLSEREKLAENWGLLFVFKQAGDYTFWMKDMKFDLDFVFINGDTVVDLSENIPHPDQGQEPQTVNAAEPIDKALEINAGQIKKLGLKIGDIIKLTL